MIKKNNYSYQYPLEDQTIIKKLSDPNYEGGNILVPETAPTEEKMKYSVSQSLLAYQQSTQKSFADLVKEIDIQSLTPQKLVDICRGKLTTFSLGELLIYANNLRITFIPCYQCGINLYPPLLGEMLSAFQKQVSFQPKKVYREHTHLPIG